jgi:hypothetical protein
VILADTSVWVDHLRAPNGEMRRLLGVGEIIMHPFVLAEIALVSLRDRKETLRELDLLIQAQMAQVSEVRNLIEARNLYSRGIGFVDAHLIAAALLNSGVQLWTRDKRLRAVAEFFGIEAHLP